VSVPTPALRVDWRTSCSLVGSVLEYLSLPLLFPLGVAVLAVDASQATEPIPLFDIVSATVATLGNVGPGFGVVGPMNSYLPFTDLSKLVMVFLMWAGRLEILPVFVLLTRAYWRS